MNLDSAFVFGFCCLFVRCSAMLLSSPLAGTVVPVMVRVMTASVLSLALLPVVQSHLPPVPADLPSLALSIGREALIGLLIGFSLQILTSVFQMAGSLIDLQAGLSSAQVFSPMTASASTPFARFKFMLAIVMLFSANAHQMMIKAFVQSYEFSGGTVGGWEASMQHLVGLVGNSLVLALQIAAPAAGVCALIDLAAGLINRAVPQTQPFLLALPAKLALSLGVLAVALPTMTYGVTVGIDRTFDSMFQIVKGI